MHLETLISNSNNFFYIDRLDETIKIASITKAKYFHLLANSDILYGSFEEPYSMITTKLPFTSSNDLWFSSTMFGNKIAKNIINQYKTFFYVLEYPYILFAENRRADLMNGRIGIDYDTLTFIDMVTGNPIDGCLFTHNLEDKFIMDGFKDLYCRWINSMPYYTINPAIVYEHMENNDAIQYVTQNKVTEGSVIMNLSEGFTFYVFKSLIGSLTRQDTLTMNIYPDPFLANSMVIEFIVHKNKLKIEGMKDFKTTDIHTYIRTINLK